MKHALLSPDGVYYVTEISIPRVPIWFSQTIFFIKWEVSEHFTCILRCGRLKGMFLLQTKKENNFKRFTEWMEEQPTFFIIL
jgi:hypothetical protein